MSKHTKGPWRMDSNGIITGGNYFCTTIAEVPIAKWYLQAYNAMNTQDTETAKWCNFNGKEAQANAALIAAAPEMYEALKQLFEHCAMIHKHWGDGNNQKEADEAIKKGTQALTKAEGMAE